MRHCLILFILILFSASVFAADKGISVEMKRPVGESGQRRLALVIGNSAYQHSGALANPTRDAELIAKTLEDVGFDLHGGGAQLDLTRRALDQAIESFGDSIKPGDVALFYYSGHGLQVAGENYLVPVDANIKKESEVRVKTVPVNLLFSKLDGIPRAVNIVVLDACRNNPFARSFRSSSGGLASITNVPSGTLVAFSTSPGQVAEDGSGNNSTYTKALAKYMKEPNLSVENVFKKVRAEVMGTTGGVQTPWENTSLTGNFKFIDAAAMKAALAKQGAAKSAELERLLKMEAEARAARQKEQAELAGRQAELDKMDAEIEAMRSRLGAGSAAGSDDLKNMVALVKQRETQAKQLERLKAEKALQERKRAEEIARLKAQEKDKRRAAVEATIADYETIANSPYGKDIIGAAWQSLIADYPEAQKVKVGDLNLFRLIAIDNLTFSEAQKFLSDAERVMSKVDKDSIKWPTLGMKNRNAVAVVICNKNYSQKGKGVPNADYAHNDFDQVVQYLTQTLGYNPGNILCLKDAALNDLIATFGNQKSYRGKLYNLVRPGVSDVYIYYSGHGTPSLSSGQGYLLPVDGDPTVVELTGYPLAQLFNNLKKLPAKSLTVVLDSSFSGASAKGPLVRSASSISVRLTSVEPSKFPFKAAIIFASGLSEVSSWDEKAKLGLFTRQYLNGARGQADKNNDNFVTFDELKDYVSEEVSYLARRDFGRSQHPRFIH